jgi:hypothetical protein
MIASFSVASWAQGERATATGLVTDPSGSIIVGAQVSIRNLDTNVVIKTKTNSAGIYYLPALPPGRYELRVEQAGFRPAVVSDIPLGAGLTGTFNVTLEIGTITEAVQVRATAVQLEAQTTGLGKVLENRTIAEMPLLGRNPTQLVSLLPGVTPLGGGTVGDNGGVKMSGGLATQNGLLTDGVESRATIRTDTQFVVPLESVAETRVDTATYAAEYGRSGGGVVNMVTKSGTNEIHGVGYEFIRNDHLNANSWQNNRNLVPRALYQQNRFGAAVGGPIIHNRTFFFVNYEGVRDRSPNQYLDTVPTALQRQGDFSQTLAPDRSQVLVYDPLTTRADLARAGQYIRDPFPSDRIPTNRLHPISLNVEKYWPNPNRPGEGPSLFNNYFVASKTANTTDLWVTRIDHIISDKHRLFGRFSGRQYESAPSGLGNENLAFPATAVNTAPTRSAMISLVSTFSPSLLGELRLGYTRIQGNSVPTSAGFDIASLGFPQSLANQVQYKEFPQIYVYQYTVGTGLSVQGGSSAEAGLLSGAQPSSIPEDTYQVQYHVTFLRNRHKIKAGTDLELLRLASFNAIYPDGIYYFDRVFTQGPDPLVRSTNGGSGLASFLLGVPQAGNLSFGPHLKIYGKYYGLYFQDDIQLTNKLTANLGVRYEYTTPWAEQFGQVGNFNFAATEPTTGQKGNFEFVQPKQQLWEPENKKIAPRIGLAYRMTAKTVIRASGGIFYAPNDTLNAGTSDWGNGLYLVNEGTLGPPNPIPNTPPVGGSWTNPFAGGLIQPTRDTTFIGQNVRAHSRNHHVAYVSNWTFNIQKMVTPTLLVEVGYVGSKTTHLAQNRFFNANDPLLLSLGSSLLDTVPNPFYGTIKSGNLSFSTVQRRQLLRPYPQFLQVLIPRDGYGDANYESFQLRVDKQYSHGLTLTGAYTISKNIGNNFESATGEVGPQDALYNPNYSRGLNTNDIPQRLVLGYMYEIPLGKRRPHLSTGPLASIIGNWQVSGITVIQSGIPLRIAAPDNTGLLDFGLNVGRGNRLRDPVLPAGQRSTDRWFDTSAFVQAPPYTMPNDSITQPRLRDPGRQNFDMALIRNQPFRERYNVQFRAEVFNVFNHAALSLGSGSSVTVGTPQFGKILSGTNPRNIQLGLRLVF